MSYVGRDSNGAFVPVVRVGRTERVSVSGTSAGPSTPPAATTQILRLVADVDIHYRIGEAPTAAADTSPFLPAGAVEFIHIRPGETVEVIQTTTGGFAWISECG